MTIKNKQKLLGMLIENEQFRSAAFLADRLGVSARTIHAYLDELDDLIQRTSLVLERRPGAGIRLIGSHSDKLFCLTAISRGTRIDLDPADRQFEIIRNLLEGNRVSYHDLAEYYFVSRATIVKDIRHIRHDFLLGDDLLSSNNDGTILMTDERTHQALWGRYLSLKYENHSGHPPISLRSYGDFIEDELNVLYEYIEIIQNEVEQIGTAYQLADYYRVKLFENLVVLMYRIILGHHHKESSGYIFERVTSLDTYYIANDLAARLEQQTKEYLSTEDRLYINDCLIANGLKNIHSIDTHSYYQRLVSELVSKVSGMINEDLSEDEQLLNGLLHHIIPMFFRLKNGIALQNPYIREIKKQYSMMFHLTWYGVLDLERELGRRIPEDEIAFLMIHFQSALERKRDIRKILIISQTGLLTTEILERRIKQFLPSVHIYEVIAEDQIGQMDLKKVDLIISTVPLSIDEPPVIPLSSIPTDAELRDVMNKMTELFSSSYVLSSRHEGLSQEHPLVDSLSRRLSITRGHVLSMEDAIRTLTDPLVEAGKVTDAYVKSVFDREEMSSTAFETGIAIPHGDPSFVKETQLSVLINDRKINWGGDRVDVIVLVSVTKEDIQHISLIIEQLYTVMESRTDIEKLFHSQSDQDISRYLAHYH